MTTAANPYESLTPKVLRDLVGFVPTGPEQLAILDCGGDLVLVSGGEGGGKSVVIAEMGYEHTFAYQRPILGWLVGEKYENTKKEFQYLVDSYSKLGVLHSHSKAQADQKRWIKLVDSSYWETITAGNTQNIAMERPDVILGCEAAQMSGEAIAKMVARQSAANGYLFMSGTFEKAQPHFRDTYRAWRTGLDGQKAFALPTWSNPHLFKNGFDDPRIKRLINMYGIDFVMERYGGVPRKDAGIVFNDYDPDFHVPGHNGPDLKFIPTLPVSLAIDPGYSQGRYAVLACQSPPDSPVRWFDEIFMTETYTDAIIDICEQRPWWRNVMDGVIDTQASKPIQAQPGPIDTWLRRLPNGAPLYHNYVPIQDGIEIMHRFLAKDPQGKPKQVFGLRCLGIRSEFGELPSPITGVSQSFRWKLDPQGNIKGHIPDPRYCDSIKAVWYWLIAKHGFPIPIEGAGIIAVRYH